MNINKSSMVKSLRLISTDRQRTNILRAWEQKTIAYLVQKIPSWISSDGLTAIGFFGNLMVATSFVLGAFLQQILDAPILVRIYCKLVWRFA